MSSVASASDVFRAVADPTRRSMLDLLRDRDRSAGELARPFDMTRPAASQHLRILQEAGLIRGRQDGRRRVYRINARPFRALCVWASRYQELVDPAGHVWRVTRRSRTAANRQMTEGGGNQTIASSAAASSRRHEPISTPEVSMSIKNARPDHRRITPHLLVPNTDEAVDFYRRAFGAELLYLAPLPTGEHLHAHLRIADTLVMITQEDPKGSPAMSHGVRVASPASLGGTTVILELYLDDVDRVVKQAIAEGAKERLAVSDSFWGDRFGWVEDPFGYIWALSTEREELTAKDVEDRMIQFFSKR